MTFSPLHLWYWRIREQALRRSSAYSKRRLLRRTIRAAAGINVYRSESPNIGDRYSGPSLYVTQFLDFPSIDIFQLKDPPQLRGTAVILGGGGLLHRELFGPPITAILEAEPSALIGWGLGYNTEVDRPQWKPNSLSDFDLLGLRDADTPYDWVPCASCLHSAFDKTYPVRYSTILYNHAEFPFSPPREMPEMRNHGNSFEESIRFLASGEVVITTSFHGAYWATLLGRRVVVVNPFAWKFYTMKHPPTLTETRHFERAIRRAREYPNALSECRAANEQFAEKVAVKLGRPALAPTPD